jgi:hypothetical protein
MKKSTATIILLVLFQFTFSQTTGKLSGLKDNWGELFTYTGEIKNKQPNGLGLAIYSNGNVLRYAGYFVNGVYNGKGTMLFSNGAMLSGDWKDGKLNGKGTNLTKTGTLYIGSFYDGKKDGQGTFFYSDNSILQGQWKLDKFNGRAIYIAASANTVNDNIYIDDKKNGQGYQYDLETKKLFQGTWKDGNWEGATTGNYTSFLTNADFYSEKTDKQVMAGPLNKTTKGLYDTSFFYDLVNKKRYFGVFDNGSFRKGLILRDDSTRFIGSINATGANGYASYYKVGSFFDEGNYTNDYLQGPGCLSVDLKAKTIYYGEMSDKGLFTGKAWFANDKNDLFNGEYKKGTFTGNGYLIIADGHCVKGIWEDGYPLTVTSFTDADGINIGTTPKTLADGIALVAQQAKDDLNVLLGQKEDNLDFKLINKSILSFPGGLKKDIIKEDDDFDLNYIVTYLETTDFIKAKDKYLELCKQLDMIKISLYKTEPAFELEGTPKEPDNTRSINACSFIFPYHKVLPSSYAASVVMVKNEKNNYMVQLVLGNMISSYLTGEE